MFEDVPEQVVGARREKVVIPLAAESSEDVVLCPDRALNPLIEMPVALNVHAGPLFLTASGAAQLPAAPPPGSVIVNRGRGAVVYELQEKARNCVPGGEFILRLATLPATRPASAAHGRAAPD